MHIRNLHEYFANLDGAKPHALHEMVLQAASGRCSSSRWNAPAATSRQRGTARNQPQTLRKS